MKYWKSLAKHLYLSVNINKSPSEVGGENFHIFLQQKIVNYRAGAKASILTGWSRVKMERLHNTGDTPEGRGGGGREDYHALG